MAKRGRSKRRAEKRAAARGGQAQAEQQTGAGTRDYGRMEGQAAHLEADAAPGDGEGGMGDHMGATDVGNDFGRYGGTQTAPEDTKQNANPPSHELDREVGRTDAGPRDAYGRPVADGAVEEGEDDEAGTSGGGSAGGAAPVGQAGGYGPQDTRAADDTLGGYGGLAGGEDFRPEEQRRKERPEK